MWPNLVIDGKGRFSHRRILSKDDIEDDEIMTSEQNQVGREKTSVRVKHPSATLSEDYTVLLFNDTNQEETYTISFDSILANTNVSKKVIYDSVEKTSPFDVTVPAYSYKEITIRIENSADTSPTMWRNISSVWLKAEHEDSSEYWDTVVAVLATPLAEFTDVQRQFEDFLADESIFKSGATYSAQDVIEDYLLTATEEVFNIVQPLWRKHIEELMLAKQYCIFRSILLTFERTTAYSSTGADIWVEPIRIIKEELRVLNERMLTGG